jgi:CheY-like chemotaxis protein
MTILMRENGTTLEAHRPRVLLVDNDSMAMRMLGRLLKNCGYDVAEQYDSTKAHLFARRFQPDLMILDLPMPWKTGNEMADIFALHEELSNVPVIFMTGHALLGQHLSSSFRVLIKPFAVEDLLNCIKEGLEQRFQKDIAKESSMKHSS